MEDTHIIEETTETASNMSRRSFLTLGAVATAAVAGSSLVGCASGSTDGAAAETVASAADPIAPVAAPAAWDREADVVIAGSGGGLVAAVRAAELGAKVIVVEKSSSWGGASKETDIFSVMGTKTQAALYAQYAEALKDVMPDKAPILAQLAQAPLEAMQQKWLSGYMNKQHAEFSSTQQTFLPCHQDMPLLQSLITNIPSAIDWIGEQGVQWDVTHEMGTAGMMAGLSPAGSEAGGFVARANQVVFETLYNKAVETGVEFLFDTPATALVVTDGAVVGLQAKDGSGTTLHIKANKGVLLATGGMTNNKDLLARYVPSVAYRCLTSTAGPQDTGDGIRMGIGAGAETAGFDSSFVFDGGIEDPMWNHYLYKGDVQIARQPWLSINREGARHNYYPVDDGGFTMQCQIHMVQPGNRNYVFFDADYDTYIRQFGQMICRNPILPEMGEEGADFDRLPDAVCEKDYRIGVQQGIEKGWIKQADTLEELAVALGLAPEVVTASVEDWNAICAAGVDQQMGYKAEWLTPVAKAPFYGMAVGGTVLSTMCGLRVNPTFQVMGTNGQPIPGLWASGANMGGASGDSTYGSCQHPGGGVAYTSGTSWAAVNAMLA